MSQRKGGSNGQHGEGGRATQAVTAAGGQRVGHVGWFQAANRPRGAQVYESLIRAPDGPSCHPPLSADLARFKKKIGRALFFGSRPTSLFPSQTL